jgi:glycoside/pentoside/hexuronide:cation symporter, GPH family
MTINRKSSIAYGMGGAVFAVKEAAFTMFVLLFYTQVLGLSGTVTGIVLFLALLWDAVSDPMMGTWSDRFHSRWGRRHPFMLAGLLPLALGFVALFNPPQWAVQDSTWLAGWLLACSLWIRTAVTVFALPHLALAAEMTSDYHERSHLLGARVGCLFMMAIMLPALSMYFLFGETTGIDGRFVPENYIAYGWVSALAVIVAGLITIVGTWAYIEATRIEPSRMPNSAGLSGMMKDFFSTFSNMNFRNLLFYDLAASSSYGIAVTLNIILWTYYWELDATQTSIVMAVPVLLAVPAALITMAKIGRHWSKHKILRTSIILMLIDVIWIYPLRMLELIPENGHALVLALVVLQNFVFVYFFVLRNVASYSITADLTDEHEARSGKRQEGSFYSALAFTTKLASAIGPLYAGVVLDMIGLKEGLLPGDISQSMLTQLVLALAIVVIPLMLLAWYYTQKVSMSKEQLLEIQQSLKTQGVQTAADLERA